MIFKLAKWQLGCQILYCLSDFHTPNEPHNLVSNEHRATIVRAAKTYDAHVIVEDGLRYIDNEQSNIQDYVAPHILLMQLTCKDTPLFGLSSICHHAGVSTTNVEFRIGIRTICSMEYDTVSKTLDRVYQAIERIRYYNDGPIANAWYKKILDEYEQFSNGPAHYFLQQLHAKANWTISGELLESIPYSSDIQLALEKLDPSLEWSCMGHWQQKYQLLVTLGLTLLDAELIHVLMQYSNKKIVFICAGALHISHIEIALEQLGYTRILSVGNDLITEGCQYKEPKAIPVSKLSSLLELKEMPFPFLLETNLYIQSLFDRNNFNSVARIGILSFLVLASTMSILSVLPTSRLNQTLWRCFFCSYLISSGFLWYLAQPIQIIRHNRLFFHQDDV